jgi:hypothetical protein
MTIRSVLGTAGALALASLALAASAQNPVKPSKDTLRAAILAAPVDPATQVDPASMPGKLGRRALQALGLKAEQLHEERAATYSATHLEDDRGRLSVYFASVVKQGDRWVFWSPELAKETSLPGSEMQLAFDTERDARYLVDFALDTAEQDFAILIGDTRIDQAPVGGHLAAVATGTGKRLVVRVLPLGDANTKTLRFTLFQVTVTPVG